MLRLYNTLSKKVEEFTPLTTKDIGYYSCGPTVYDFAHLGHARTYLFADILEKTLILNGYKVKRVMNITDVGHLTSDADTGEDKIEKGALRERKSVWDIASFYTDDFFEMTDKLHIKKPEIICYATDHIPEMIQMIGVLEKKGYTYNIADGVYFDTSKYRTYGRLTGLTFDKLQENLKAGVRIEMVKGKKHVTDFALWKLTPKGVSRQMEWDSPWGRGFPGWHIECSAMSMKYLGETFDIHTGGVDHIQIHHTNEIAQSEASTGKPFVRFWLHAEHLLVEGKKMSKSLGNFYKLSDLEEKGYHPLALRYLFLSASYRQQLNFTWKGLESSQIALRRLQEQITSVRLQHTGGDRVSLSEEKLEKINIYRQKFLDALNDDLNTSRAVSVLWEVLKSNIPPGDKYDLALFFDEVLGLGFSDTSILETSSPVPPEIQQLVTLRDEFRKKRDYKKSDEVRQQIEKLGYVVKDSSTGTKVTKSTQ